MVQIEKAGSGYLVWWDNGVEIRVRRITDTRSAFRAELTFFHNNSPLHRSNVTMDDAGRMDSISAAMDRRLPKENFGIDWTSTIEDLAGILIDTHRAGFEAQGLGEVLESDQPTWLLDNLLIADNSNLYWADGGSGKSYFACWLSTLISEGRSEQGLHVVKPGRVLYLDWETTASSIAARMGRIHKGLDIESPSQVMYKRMISPLESDIDSVQGIVHEHDITLVVYDSMGMAMAGQLESQEDVTNFFRTVDSIGGTSLIITHANKSGVLFGSQFIYNRARSVYEVSQTQSLRGSGSIDFNVWHRKANDVPLQVPQSWNVSITEDEVQYNRIDTFLTAAASQLSPKRLAYKLLETGPPRNKDFLVDKIIEIKSPDTAGERDKLPGEIETAIESLVDDGTIARSQNAQGTYALVGDTEKRGYFRV